MGWVCHGVRAKMESDKGFRNIVAEIQTRSINKRLDLQKFPLALCRPINRTAVDSHSQSY